MRDPAASTGTPSMLLRQLKSSLRSSRFTRDFAVTLLGQIGVLALGVVSSVLAARLLGPQGRGELAAIILWPMLLIFLFSIGMNQSIVFHTGKRRFEISEIWSSALAIGLVLSACAVIAGLWVIPAALRHYSPEDRRLALIFLAFVPLIWLTGIPAGLMQGKLELGYFAALRVMSSFLYALGLLGLYLSDRPYVQDALAVQVCALIVVAAWGFWLISRELKPHWVFSFSACRSLLNFGWKTQAGDLASYVNQRLDQLLLTLFVPPRDLGFYVVAVTVSMSVGFFPQAAGIVTLATGSNSGPEQTKKVIAKSFGTTFFVLALGCGALYFVCPWLVPFAFGASFAPAVTACRILLPGSVALGLNQVLFSGARALDHPALPSYTEGFAVAVTCAALYLLLPRYGFVGAAIASTLAYVSSLVLLLALFYRRLNISPLDLVEGFPALIMRRVNPWMPLAGRKRRCES